MRSMPPLELHVDLRPGVLDLVAAADEAVVRDDRTTTTRITRTMITMMTGSMATSVRAERRSTGDGSTGDAACGRSPRSGPPGTSSRTGRHAASPASRSRSARARSSTIGRSASASARRSPGSTSSESTSSVATLRYPSSALATTVVPAAMASISTTPNDSPCSDGAQNTSAASQTGDLVVVGDPPSHSIRGSPAVEPISLGVGAVAADPQPDRQRMLLHGLDEHAEALCAPRDVRRRRRPERRRRGRSTVWLSGSRRVRRR